MEVIFINKLYKCPVTIVVGEAECFLSEDENCSISLYEDNVKIIIRPQKNSKVKTSWTNWFIGNADPEAAYSTIVCSCCFNLTAIQDNASVIILENKSRADDKTCFYSVKLDAENTDPADVCYQIVTRQSIIKRYRRMMLWVLSGLPIFIMAIIGMFIKPSIELAIGSAVILLIGIIPSIKRIKKFTNICSDAVANEYLLLEIEKRNALDIFEEFANLGIQEKEHNGFVKSVFKLLKRWINST